MGQIFDKLSYALDPRPPPPGGIDMQQRERDGPFTVIPKRIGWILSRQLFSRQLKYWSIVVNLKPCSLATPARWGMTVLA